MYSVLSCHGVCVCVHVRTRWFMPDKICLIPPVPSCLSLGRAQVGVPHLHPVAEVQRQRKRREPSTSRLVALLAESMTAKTKEWHKTGGACWRPKRFTVLLGPFERS